MHYGPNIEYETKTVRILIGQCPKDFPEQEGEWVHDGRGIIPQDWQDFLNKNFSDREYLEIEVCFEEASYYIDANGLEPPEGETTQTIESVNIQGTSDSLLNTDWLSYTLFG